MKKNFLFVLISILLFGSISISAMSSEEVLEKVQHKPYDPELLFMASVINFFKGDYDNSLRYFVRASLFDRNIISRKDYGMIEALSKYTRNILSNSNKTELKIYSCLFLDRMGEKKYSYAYLQSLYEKVEDENDKVIISRIMNSINFKNTL